MGLVLGSGGGPCLGQLWVVLVAMVVVSGCRWEAWWCDGGRRGWDVGLVHQAQYVLVVSQLGQGYWQGVVHGLDIGCSVCGGGLCVGCLVEFLLVLVCKELVDDVAGHGPLEDWAIDMRGLHVHHQLAKWVWTHAICIGDDCCA